MSKLWTVLSAMGLLLMLGGTAGTVASLAAGTTGVVFPLRLCAGGALLLVPEFLRRWQLRRRGATAERRRLLEEAEQQRLQSEQAELDRRNQAQSSFDFFLGGAEPLVYPSLNHLVTRVSLPPGEDCCASGAEVESISTRRHAPVARSGQLPLRITWHLDYQIAPFRGNSLVDVSERVSSRGSLFVTNRRVLYFSTGIVQTTPVEEIQDVQLDGDRVILLVHGRLHPVIFHIAQRYRAPVLAAAIFRMSEKRKGNAPPPQAPASAPAKPAQRQHE